MRISVIIPAWCERERILRAVREATALGDEVVVADAGSPDGTAEVARSAGARVVQAPKGRGRQLHAGAQAASGEVLLFLHADVSLGPGARRAILEALEEPRVVGGNFRLCFDDGTRAGRLMERFCDLRRRWLRVYYGDSAIFIRREVYERLGGFRPLPIMEDYELVCRLERLGRTAYVRAPAAVASARRFARAPLRAVAVWVTIQVLYWLGVPATRLARLYADLR